MPLPRACGVDVESLINSSTSKLAKRQIVHWHCGELEQLVHSHPMRLSHRSAGEQTAALRTQLNRRVRITNECRQFGSRKTCASAYLK